MGSFHLAENLHLSLASLPQKGSYLGQLEEEKLYWSLHMFHLQKRRRDN